MISHNHIVPLNCPSHFVNNHTTILFHLTNLTPFVNTCAIVKCHSIVLAPFVILSEAKDLVSQYK